MDVCELEGGSEGPGFGLAASGEDEVIQRWPLVVTEQLTDVGTPLVKPDVRAGTSSLGHMSDHVVDRCPP